MEIQALLTSNILPNDIVCNQIYNHLWRNRNILNEAQTDSIVNDDFHLKKIVRLYLNGVYSLSLRAYLNGTENVVVEKYSDDYFMKLYNDVGLNGLNNDMCRFLMKGVEDEELYQPAELYQDKLYHTQLVWKQMTTSDKLEFYQIVYKQKFRNR